MYHHSLIDFTGSCFTVIDKYSAHSHFNSHTSLASYEPNRTGLFCSPTNSCTFFNTSWITDTCHSALTNVEGHSQVAGLFKCNLWNICAAFYTISADSVLARFHCISRASRWVNASRMRVLSVNHPINSFDLMPQEPLVALRNTELY